MTWLASRGRLVHLGTLHGSGDLFGEPGARALGIVTYEIDGYRERAMTTANGQIEGNAAILKQAFQCESVSLALAGGVTLSLTVADPKGAAATEVRVQGTMPDFGRPA